MPHKEKRKTIALGSPENLRGKKERDVVRERLRSGEKVTDYKPKERHKMDGQKQTIYPRKNWSSFIVFNCEHPSNKKLNIDLVNSESGSFLHQFKWLNDDEIGSLDERWNWLEGWTSNSNKSHPYAIHYTRGGPWFDEWQDVEFAKEWLQERDLYLKNKFII